MSTFLDGLAKTIFWLTVAVAVAVVIWCVVWLFINAFGLILIILGALLIVWAADRTLA